MFVLACVHIVVALFVWAAGSCGNNRDVQMLVEAVGMTGLQHL